MYWKVLVPMSAHSRRSDSSSLSPINTSIKREEERKEKGNKWVEKEVSYLKSHLTFFRPNKGRLPNKFKKILIGIFSIGVSTHPRKK
jgi:hypothetical protein